MTKQDRINRIIAKGEGSNHSHVMIGDCKVSRNKEGEILIKVGDEGAVLKHILESNWLQGEEKHTNEHEEISLIGFPKQIRQGDVMLELVSKDTYQYIPQMEYHPYNKMIVKVID